MKNTIPVLVSIGIALAPATSFAKKVEAPSALALQQLQSRDIEATKDQVFGAVISVLQDSGYRIQAADKDTGLITGIASTQSHTVYSLWSGLGKSKKSPIASVFIEQRTPTVTSVRISFVMAKVKSSIYGSQPQDEEPIYDAEVYQSAFEKINQAVFVRKNMTTTSSVTPAAAAATTVTTAAAPTAASTAPAAPKQ